MYFLGDLIPRFLCLVKRYRLKVRLAKIAHSEMVLNEDEPADYRSNDGAIREIWLCYVPEVRPVIKAVGKIGHVLAFELEGHGEDPTPLLTFLTCFDEYQDRATESLWPALSAGLQRIALRRENGGAGSGTPSADATGQGEGGKPKRRAARRKRSDPKADKMLAEAWGTGHYPTYAALANEKGMTTRDVKLAIDRHRKREAAKRLAREKPRQERTA